MVGVDRLSNEFIGGFAVLGNGIASKWLECECARFVDPSLCLAPMVEPCDVINGELAVCTWRADILPSGIFVGTIVKGGLGLVAHGDIWHCALVRRRDTQEACTCFEIVNDDAAAVGNCVLNTLFAYG